MEGEPPAVVDDRVPHPKPALLRLPEVVGSDDPGDAVLEVDRDDAVVGIAGRGEVRRVDHLDLRLRAIALVVELLLHPRDVRVRLLDGEASRGLEALDVPDVS